MVTVTAESWREIERLWTKLETQVCIMLIWLHNLVLALMGVVGWNSNVPI
jgi:hypothetical protein